jgi:hypothetical protein
VFFSHRNAGRGRRAPRTLRLGRQLLTNDPAAVDAYLRELPLSPREILSIDMERRHFEIAVPRVVEDWHNRWIALHEKFARQLYGDVVVDAKLAHAPVDTGPPAVSRVSSGTDRNVAATSTPSPEDTRWSVGSPSTATTRSARCAAT